MTLDDHRVTMTSKVGTDDDAGIISIIIIIIIINIIIKIKKINKK